MTAPTIKPSIYLTQAVDKLKKLDPINRDVAAPFKKVNEKAEKAMSYLNASQKGLTEFERITNVILKNTGVGVDFSSVKNRVEQAMGAVGKLTAVAAGIQKSIVSQIDNVKGKIDAVKGYAADITQRVGATINGVFKAIEGGVLSEVKAVMGTVDRMVGDGISYFKTFDIGAQVAFIKGTADKLMDWKMPEVITSAVNAIKDVKLRDTVFGEILAKAASLGDLPMVKYFKDKVSDGYKYLVGDVSVSGLLANFKIDGKLGQSLKAIGTDLVATLDDINPDWATNLKNSTSGRLGAIVGASVDAIGALSRTDTHRGLALASMGVTRESVDQIIRRQYPYARY